RGWPGPQRRIQITADPPRTAADTGRGMAVEKLKTECRAAQTRSDRVCSRVIPIPQLPRIQSTSMGARLGGASRAGTAKKRPPLLLTLATSKRTIVELVLRWSFG